MCTCKQNNSDVTSKAQASCKISGFQPAAGGNNSSFEHDILCKSVTSLREW